MLKCSPISRSVGGNPRSTIEAEMKSRMSRCRWVSASAMSTVLVVLNAHTVLNTSSPCQFFYAISPPFRQRREDLGVGWPALLLAVATAIAAMRAAVERGDLDEAARIGANAGPSVVERALMSRDRSTQLAGIA